jgi:hypothetical protein
MRLGLDDLARQEAYRALFVSAIDQGDLVEIRYCTHKGLALGSERFKDAIEALGLRRATSKGAWRPRKCGVCPIEFVRGADGLYNYVVTGFADPKFYQAGCGEAAAAP